MLYGRAHLIRPYQASDSFIWQCMYFAAHQKHKHEAYLDHTVVLYPPVRSGLTPQEIQHNRRLRIQEQEQGWKWLLILTDGGLFCVRVNHTQTDLVEARNWFKPWSGTSVTCAASYLIAPRCCRLLVLPLTFGSLGQYLYLPLLLSFLCFHVCLCVHVCWRIKVLILPYCSAVVVDAAMVLECKGSAVWLLCHESDYVLECEDVAMAQRLYTLLAKAQASIE